MDGLNIASLVRRKACHAKERAKYRIVCRKRETGTHSGARGRGAGIRCGVEREKTI